MSVDVTTGIITSTNDLSGYPDVHFYRNPKKEAFWVLEVAAREFNADRLSPTQVAKILVEKFGISASSQSVASVLGKAAKKGLVHKKPNTSEFKLMEKGREELYLTSTGNPGVFYIEPGKPFSAKRILFNDVLSKLRNRVWICDPYIAVRLLDILHNLDRNIEIRILTDQVQDQSAFARALIEFKQEHPNTEVKKAPPGVLHDRYILSDTGMWLVGHSLKDLGSKESFVVKLGDDIRDSMDTVFKSRWSSSKALI